MKKSLMIFSTIFFALLTPAQAHQPSTVEDEIEIENPYISHAIYGEFLEGDEVFRVRMKFDRAFATPFDILVPRQRGLKEHRPAYAVLGPGLFEPTQAQRDALPREVPANAGVFVEMNDRAERAVFFESVMRRVYWTAGSTALRLMPGEYEVWIWSPEETTGPFALSFGVEEGGDYSGVFKDWATYAY